VLSEASSSELPQVAFYYPGPMWRGSDYIKNLLVFFDGVALLVPEYMRDRPFDFDPAVATGLKDQGLLHTSSRSSYLTKPRPKRLQQHSGTSLLVERLMTSLRRTLVLRVIS
jgi:hypothetical protein